MDCEKYKGAAVRSRYIFFKEVNSSSKYVFDLERHYSKTKSMSHIKLEDGSVSHDETVIISETIKYYKQLYCAVDVDLHKMGIF